MDRDGTKGLRVVFAGGGTGGHICPAIAVADALTARDPESEVLFVGSEKPLERRILGTTGYRHAAVECRPPSAGAWRCVWSQATGVRQALALLREFAPDVVLGLGGFPSVPGVLAARWLGLPIALFEPNAVAGRANVFLARFAEEAYSHWTGLELGCAVAETGTPLRVDMSALPETGEARRSWGLPEDRPVVLVTGGSQGARALNGWVAREAAGARDAGVSFLHLAGSEEGAREVGEAYAAAGVAHRVEAFCDDMRRAYAAASMAVTRGGGATLAELEAAGVPGLVVPLAKSAGDHQRANAKAFAQTGAGLWVEESRLDGAVWGEVLALARDAARGDERATPSDRPTAAHTVLDRLQRLAAGSEVVETSRAA